MNLQNISTYWVALIAILTGLSGLTSFDWKTEIRKLSSNSNAVLQIFYLVTLLAGAFIFRDTWLSGGGGGGSGYAAGY